jgi:hypothetical protein
MTRTTAEMRRTAATLSGDDTAGGSEHNIAVCRWEVVNTTTGDRAAAESLEAIVFASRTLVDDHVSVGGDRRSARLGSTVLRDGVYHNEGTRRARLGWS